MGIRWGFGFGPIRISGPIGFPAPTPAGIAIAVVAGIVIWIVEPILRAFVSAFIFVFSLGGADETYSLLVFTTCFYLLGSVLSLAGVRGWRVVPLAGTSPAVFVIFWSQVPLVNPDLLRLSNTAAQEIFGTTLVAFASAGSWIVAITGSLVTFLVTTLLLKWVEPRLRRAIPNA